MNIGIEAWHLWVIAAMVLFIGEVFMPGFLLASLAIGCLVAAVGQSIGGELVWGLSGFIVGSGASLLLIRPYFARALGPEETSQFGAEGMLGDVITVTDASDVGGSLKARYRDSLWSLRCEDEVFEGDRVVITAVESGLLVVKPVKEEV